MISETPLVSIQMLTFNHEKFISQAITSVLSQKVNFTYEIIIGEDCSTDNTLPIIRQFEKKHADIIRVSANTFNLGAIENIIKTTKMCRGKYIAVIEGDDYWSDEFKLQKQVEFLETHPDYGLVHSDVDLYFDDIRTLLEDFNACNDVRIPEGNIYDELLDPENYLIRTPTAVFRKELLDRYVDYELLREKGWVQADLYQWLSLARYTKIKYMPESLATYRVLSNSMSNTKDYERKLRLHRSAYEIRFYFIEKFGCSKDLQQKVQRMFVSALSMDAFKLNDSSLAKWVTRYSTERNIKISIKNRILLRMAMIRGKTIEGFASCKRVVLKSKGKAKANAA